MTDIYNHKGLIRKARALCHGKSDEFVDGVASMLSTTICGNDSFYLYIKSKLR